ncbi:hypothetical protein [Gimesia aquarii]|uniref:Uncharacterized protein n=1 Tax=Gimesia aquarii TaxID=2527964 RepID=A0A517VRI9_9PLAN|nr:hypothetical protein [Gimesia aquarii]QDT95550.1 hypothetical protein V144x_09950 [Gimesia aquarii]
MPTVTPTGPLSLPFAGAADLLAATPTFQAVCGVASASLARQRIHIPNYDLDKNNNEWPVPGIIIADDDSNYQSINFNRDQSGSLTVTFCFPENELYVDDLQDQIIDFRNKLGAIQTESLKKANSPNPESTQGHGFLHITNWEKRFTPALLGPPDVKVKFLHAVFSIEWV